MIEQEKQQNIQSVLDAIIANHEHHIEYSELDGYRGSDLFDLNVSAIEFLSKFVIENAKEKETFSSISTAAIVGLASALFRIKQGNSVGALEVVESVRNLLIKHAKEFT